MRAVSWLWVLNNRVLLRQRRAALSQQRHPA